MGSECEGLGSVEMGMIWHIICLCVGVLNLLNYVFNSKCVL